MCSAYKKCQQDSLHFNSWLIHWDFYCADCLYDLDVQGRAYSFIQNLYTITILQLLLAVRCGFHDVILMYY